MWYSMTRPGLKNSTRESVRTIITPMPAAMMAHARPMALPESPTAEGPVGSRASTASSTNVGMATVRPVVASKNKSPNAYDFTCRVA